MKTTCAATLAAVSVVASACGGSEATQNPPLGGIRVSAASSTTTEAGGRATFTVVLLSKPTASVAVAFDSSDPTEGLVEPTRMTFTPETWNVPQTATVTGVDDTLRDRSQRYQVVFSPTVSSDPDYSAVRPEAVSLSNTDDDAAGVLTELSGITAEKGDQATLRVALNAEPRGDVTFDLRSTDETEGTLSTARLVFTPHDWMTPQTVVITGVDDPLADGLQRYAVDLFANSADQDYGGLALQVELANTDDDTADLTVSAVSGPTTEAGGRAAFNVAIHSRPAGPVLVDLRSSLPGEGEPTVASLTFTPENWTAPQTVFVAGVDDLESDGDKAYSISVSAARSQDPAYAALPPRTVLLTNMDDDRPAVLISEVSGPTTELGGTAFFTVALGAQPSSSVTLNYDSSDKTEGTVSPGFLTFTPKDWSVPKRVTVTGVHDEVADGDQGYAVVFFRPVTQDPLYARLVLPRVELRNVDAAGFCQPFTFSGFRCPTGATAWCNRVPLSATDAAQAKLACEACYGTPCTPTTMECAGPAYGPAGTGPEACGRAYFGYTVGCSGGKPGRVFDRCAADSDLGRWAP